jgi:hypothetical protein
LIDFEKALVRLADCRVRFVIVGGLAGTLYGSSFATFDLDFCYARDEENLLHLARALQSLNPRSRGAPAGLPFHFDEETLRKGMNFTLTTDLGDLDLLGEIAGIGNYVAAAEVSRPVELFGRTFSVLTLDALIASKRAAARPKDLLVLSELEALRETAEE